MTRRRSTNDLFEIFPDLPGMCHPYAHDRKENVRRQVEQARARASENALRQRAATERARAVISRRQRQP
jgi:hypothetical protein